MTHLLLTQASPVSQQESVQPVAPNLRQLVFVLPPAPESATAPFAVVVDDDEHAATLTARAPIANANTQYLHLAPGAGLTLEG